MKQKHLVKFRSIFNNLSDGMDLAESILCSVAFGEKLLPNLDGNRKAKQAIYGLRRYKFIRRTSEGGKYSLTPKGERRFRKIFIDEVIIKRPKKWDGKWRLVMYDLPTRFKKARDAFRWKLKDLDLFQLQKSVWIYPYPCEGELLLVADFFGVRRHIQILEVSKILDDRKAKMHFRL